MLNNQQSVNLAHTQYKQQMHGKNGLNVQSGKLGCNQHFQDGIGIIEVLISLFILAIGVMGYGIMQAKSIKTSDDAITRTKAISVLNETAERIRNNSISTTILKEYKDNFKLTTVSTVACTNGCTAAQIAKNDVSYVKKIAKDNDLSVSMADCPGNSTRLKRECLVAAWGKTTTNIEAVDFVSSPEACMSKEGIYRPANKTTPASQCVILELY